MTSKEYDVVKFHSDLPLDRRVDYLELVVESLQVRANTDRAQITALKRWIEENS